MLITLTTPLGDCETMVNDEHNPIKLAKVLKYLAEEKYRIIAVIEKEGMIIRLVEVNMRD